MEIQKLEKRKDYQNLISFSQSYLARAKDLVVKNDEDEKTAVELKGEIKDNIKKGEEMKRFFTEPHKKFIKLIEDKFSVIKEMKEADDIIKGKLLTYVDEKEKKIQKQKEKILKKMQENKDLDLTAVAEELEKAGTSEKTVEAGGHKVTYRIDKEVVIEDEKKLPREYLAPNMTAIKQAVLKEGKTIPGVKVVERKTPVTY